jgi:hypothetical protein
MPENVMQTVGELIGTREGAPQDKTTAVLLGNGGANLPIFAGAAGLGLYGGYKGVDALVNYLRDESLAEAAKKERKKFERALLASKRLASAGVKTAGDAEDESKQFNKALLGTILLTGVGGGAVRGATALADWLSSSDTYGDVLEENEIDANMETKQAEELQLNIDAAYQRYKQSDDSYADAVIGGGLTLGGIIAYLAHTKGYDDWKKEDKENARYKIVDKGYADRVLSAKPTFYNYGAYKRPENDEILEKKLKELEAAKAVEAVVQPEETIAEKVAQFYKQCEEAGLETMSKVMENLPAPQAAEVSQHVVGTAGRLAEDKGLGSVLVSVISNNREKAMEGAISGAAEGLKGSFIGDTFFNLPGSK